MNLKVKKLHKNAIIPVYATQGAACFDLHAMFEDGEIQSRSIDYEYTDSCTFRTGLAFEVPEGSVMLVFSRSGHGFNHDVRLANCVGVIDSDYRGELFIRLTKDTNMKSDEMTVKHGDRIAQAMVISVTKMTLIESDELSDTVRGTGGLGSTGS